VVLVLRQLGGVRLVQQAQQDDAGNEHPTADDAHRQLAAMCGLIGTGARDAENGGVSGAV
jgi:hypothetical protein